MVEVEFAFLEVQVEGVSGHALERGEAMLGIGLEALDAVDVVGALGEPVVGVVDPKVLGIAHVDEAVIAAPAVGMDHALQVDPSNI